MRAGLLQTLPVQCSYWVAGDSLLRTCTLLLALILVPVDRVRAKEPGTNDTASSRETQADATRRIPIQLLNRETQALVNDVIEKPSFFRRMPAQTIDCDPEMFQHLVRYPEVLVNIWDVMGITKVQATRTGPYTFTADDGVGTTCNCDLVFGNDKVHIYYGTGAYQGNLAPRKVTGRCVCVLYSKTNTTPGSGSTIQGSMDVFLKLDNLGADLLTRTLSPLVGKTADYNFVESAKFLSQISQVCERNPGGAQMLASKLTKVQPQIRDEFARIAHRIGSEASNGIDGQQFASMDADGMRSLPRSSPESAQAGPGSASGRLTDTPSLQPSGEWTQQHNPERVPPMAFRGATENESSPRENPGLVNPRTRSIAPSKPNIYMRR